MKTIAISGSLRGNVGKRDAKELRYEGKVPAVLYGGKGQTHFSVLASDLKLLIFSSDVSFVGLEIDGVTTQAIIQDTQFHPLTDQIIHIDFLELQLDKPIVMQIPVQLTGTSPGVKMGGKLFQKLRKLRVRALPADMPQYVQVNINTLDVGHAVRVRDLDFKGYDVINTPEDTIVSVTTSRALRQAEQDAVKGK
ncbi:50S ribosomal protein L25/general stress protein Ctc [Arcticibacter eurypsychrophilus]|uniref:50S ribosomal protein L25/general stress protein Ctc n=1 Tax=Arcticibacter eurypsychrophilus TaxID=1434752 RepID=UPI00084D90FE|nr:50S ribosomal protein L25/general stress protein Ctc [Arcticibacter eurypsychrophilus]